MDRDFTPEDLERNRFRGGLGYIVFFIPLIACPDSKLGRYCANQGLILTVLILLASLLGAVLAGIPWIGWLFRLAGGLADLALVTGGILCYAQLMTTGRVIELPFVGGLRLLP